MSELTPERKEYLKIQIDYWREMGEIALRTYNRSLQELQSYESELGNE